jgi:hypothetical protein
VPLLAVALALLNEGLVWWSEKVWYEGRQIPGLQAGYLALWDGALLAWFAWGQWSRRHFRRRAWLAAFWSGQLLWLALGLWCISVPLAEQPIAIGAAPAWLLGALAWALWVEHRDHGREAAAALPEASPYMDVLKALGRKD